MISIQYVVLNIKKITSTTASGHSGTNTSTQKIEGVNRDEELVSVLDLMKLIVSMIMSKNINTPTTASERSGINTLTQLPTLTTASGRSGINTEYFK